MIETGVRPPVETLKFHPTVTLRISETEQIPVCISWHNFKMQEVPFLCAEVVYFLWLHVKSKKK